METDILNLIEHFWEDDPETPHFTLGLGHYKSHQIRDRQMTVLDVD